MLGATLHSSDSVRTMSKLPFRGHQNFVRGTARFSPGRFPFASCRTKSEDCRPCRSMRSVSNDLIQVLKDEYKFQKEDYRQSEAVDTGPPKPFVLKDFRGKTGFQLTRTYGKEEIAVFVCLDKQPPADPFQEEGESEEMYSKVVGFDVSISKADKILQFSCESDGESVSIVHMALDEPEEEEDEIRSVVPVYSPVFEELDDTVKQAFTDYLEERGITAELGFYLLCICDDKIALEYQTWLLNVRDFLSH